MKKDPLRPRRSVSQPKNKDPETRPAEIGAGRHPDIGIRELEHRTVFQRRRQRASQCHLQPVEKSRPCQAPPQPAYGKGPSIPSSRAGMSVSMIGALPAAHLRGVVAMAIAAIVPLSWRASIRATIYLGCVSGRVRVRSAVTASMSTVRP